MKISFVIPAYNEEAAIGQCIESIRREVAKGPYDAEIIVVDNGSTDRTRTIAESYSDVHVVQESRKGTNWARQAGFKIASGDNIVNVDADNTLPKEWLTVALRELDKKGIIAVSGPYIYPELSFMWRTLAWVFYGFAFVLYLTNRFIFRAGSMVQGGNFIVLRKALEQIGGYNTSIEFYGDDTDTAQRLSKVGEVKWTFKLRVYSSSRRFKSQGLAKSGFYYALNHFAVLFTGKPHTLQYQDVRRAEEKSHLKHE